jgi:hypothetical protein
MYGMTIRNQEVRDGLATLRRTVHEISESGRHGYIQTGYVRYEKRWFLVKKTKPVTWWNLRRPATPAETEGILRG